MKAQARKWLLKQEKVCEDSLQPFLYVCVRGVGGAAHMFRRAGKEWKGTSELKGFIISRLVLP